MRTGKVTSAPGRRALTGLLGISPNPPRPQGSQVSLGGCFRPLLCSGSQVVPTTPTPPASRCWAETWGTGVLQVRMGVGQEAAPPSWGGGGSLLTDWVPSMQLAAHHEVHQRPVREVPARGGQHQPEEAHPGHPRPLLPVLHPRHRPLVRAPARSGAGWVTGRSLSAPYLPLAPTLRPTHLSTTQLAREGGGPLAGWAQGGPEPGLCLLRAGILAGLAGWQRLSSCVSLALTCPSVRVASP